MSIDYRTFQSAGQISSHIIPGAFSRIDSVMGAGGLASASNGVIMGASEGGKPLTLYRFSTISEATNVLKGGELLEAVRFAFNPGGGFNPQRVYAMRVNSATQSDYILKSAGSDSLIKLTSRDYGSHTNRIQISVDTGTAVGKKITFRYKNNPDVVFDNVLRNSLNIASTAGSTSVAVTIINNNTTKTLTTLVDGTTPGLNIDLTDFQTLEELAAFIDADPGYSCTVFAGQEDASPSHLDNATSVDVRGASKAFTSTFQAVMDEINKGSPYVVAEDVSAATGRVSIANTGGFVYFDNGTDGVYGSSEWAAALSAMEAEDIQFVSTPNTNHAVHQAIKNHCESMSSVTGRKERQFILGGDWHSADLETDLSGKMANAIALNSKSGMLIFNGGRQYDSKGVLKEFPASYAACMLMGITCATAINDPLTFKELNFVDLEWKLTESEMERALESGLAPINYSSSGVPHLKRQLNTYQTNDLKWNEFSVVTEMYFASRDLRQYLEARFIGKPGTAVTGGVLKGAVENRLATYTDLGIFIRDPSSNKAWWNVQITISGDTVYIDYDAYVTMPVNFMFVTNHFHELIASV